MDDDQWHLDKKVPISIIGAILIQTFGIGWWISGLTADVAETKKDITEIQTYLDLTREARRKDWQEVFSRLSGVEEQLKEFREFSRESRQILNEIRDRLPARRQP